MQKDFYLNIFVDWAKLLQSMHTEHETNCLHQYGNEGWKNSTREQSMQKNLNLSQQRAQSVTDYLKSLGVSSTQIRSTMGYGEDNPVADNSTKEGRAQNRRVEVYMYASQAMIQAAEQQAN